MTNLEFNMEWLNEEDRTVIHIVGCDTVIIRESSKKGNYNDFIFHMNENGDWKCLDETDKNESWIKFVKSEKWMNLNSMFLKDNKESYYKWVMKKVSGDKDHRFNVYRRIYDYIESIEKEYECDMDNIL